MMLSIICSMALYAIPLRAMDEAPPSTALIAAGRLCQKKADHLKVSLLPGTPKSRRDRLTPRQLRFGKKTSPSQLRHSKHAFDRPPTPYSTREQAFITNGNMPELIYSLYFTALQFFQQAHTINKDDPFMTTMLKAHAYSATRQLKSMSVQRDDPSTFIVQPWRELLDFWQPQTKEPVTTVNPLLRTVRATQNFIECHAAHFTPEEVPVYRQQLFDQLTTLFYADKRSSDSFNTQKLQLYISKHHTLLPLLKSGSSSDTPTHTQILKKAQACHHKTVEVQAFIERAQNLCAIGQREFSTTAIQSRQELKSHYKGQFIDCLWHLLYLHQHAYKDQLACYHIQQHAKQLINCITMHNIADETHEDWLTITKAWDNQEQTDAQTTERLAIWADSLLPADTKKKKKKRERKAQQEHAIEIGSKVLGPLWQLLQNTHSEADALPSGGASSSSASALTACSPEQLYIQVATSSVAEKIIQQVWPGTVRLSKLGGDIQAIFRPWVRHDHHEALLAHAVDTVRSILSSPIKHTKHDLLWTAQLLLQLNEHTHYQERLVDLFQMITQELYRSYMEDHSHFNEQEVKLLHYFAHRTHDSEIEKAIVKKEATLKREKNVKKIDQSLDALFEQVSNYTSKKKEAPHTLWISIAQELLFLTNNKAYTKPLTEELQQATTNLFHYYIAHPENSDLRALLMKLVIPSLDALFEQVSGYTSRKETVPHTLWIDIAQELLFLNSNKAYTESLKERLQRVTTNLFNYYIIHTENTTVGELLIKLAIPAGMDHILECITEGLDKGPTTSLGLKALFARLGQAEKQLAHAIETGQTQELMARIEASQSAASSSSAAASSSSSS